MFKELLSYAKRPALFSRGTANFWDDPYISKHLLEAHLNPDWDAASRKPATIEKTIDWLSGYLPQQASVLDLGCGPGLYSERLARMGHRVTGIDFSRRSIEHAIESAAKQGLSIDYLYQNYLEIDYQGTFDMIILIYCDLGALVDEDRDLLLRKVYAALKPGGIFICDVFTTKYADTVKEKQSWRLTDDGFWADGPHCVLSQSFHYPVEKVVLSQTIVLREDGTRDIYRIYDHYYSEEDLVHVLSDAGFVEHKFFYDILGETDYESQEVVFVVTHK